MNKTKQILGFSAILVAFLSGVSQAFAQGGSSHGGGGGSGILKNDTVILADPFIYSAPGPLHPITIAPEIQDELKTVVQLFAAVNGSRDAKREALFLDEFMLGKRIQYFGVTSESDIPDNCNFHQPRAKLNPGESLVLLACTNGDKTYIVEPLVNKMTVREQAKLLVHEALRRVKTIDDDEYNANLFRQVNDALELALRVANDEKQGIKDRLNPDEIVRLKQLEQIVKKYELMQSQFLFARMDQEESYNSLGHDHSDQPYKKSLFHPYGGGIYEEGAQIDPDAYVGIAQYLPSKTQLAAGVSIKNSLGFAVLSLGSNAELENVDAGGNNLILDASSQMRNTRLKMSCSASVSFSDINCLLHLSEGSVLENISLLNLSDKENVAVIASEAVVVASFFTGIGPVVVKLADHAIYHGPHNRVVELKGLHLNGVNSSPCATGKYSFKPKMKSYQLYSDLEELASACSRK